MLRKQTSSSHHSFWLCLGEILCILHFASSNNLYGFTKVIGSFFTAHKQIIETQIILRESNIVPHVELTDFMLCCCQ